MTIGLPQQRTCGTMSVHYRLLTTDLAYARNRREIENRSLEYARRGITATRTSITVIPVVVHVVHNFSNPEQNISEAQIHSQIDVLNRDFRKQNSDISSVPAAFQPLAADTRIEFVLATTDPNGNPTNGITRTATTATGFTTDDRVKSAATGGADPWPSDRYLNIWVCQLNGGLLGYAQFPGGPAATDGVVITHTGFGTTGTAAAPFNLGRTTTHEIGHWLNLRHIWGDDGNGCNGSDFVDDTPNQAGPNTGIPSFPHVTCKNGPNGDMFMNYMDYTDDAGMLMFTEGQVARMRAVLDFVSGRLLSYGDSGTPGNVSSPVVVGFGGWLDFKFLFAGTNILGENRIYAVNQSGELLSYGDSGTPGNVSSPVVVGFGGWLDFKFLFAGTNILGENRIYAVNQSGELLSYGDSGTPGNVSSPVVVGFGGWLDFKFLFAGTNILGENRIYAVVA